MPTLADVRQRFPEYSDMSDADLASALHRKFYSDMPRADFDKKIGLANQGADSASMLPRAIADVPGEIYDAASEATKSISANLNPFSDERRTSNERHSQMGFLESLGETAKQTLGVGKGLAAIPALVASPITGAARSMIGHPYADITGMPYDEAKDAVDTAMMALGPRSASPKGLRPAPKEVPTSEQLRSAAKTAYNSPEVTALRIDPQSTNVLASKIENDLLKAGFRPTQSSAADTFKIVRDELRSTPRAGYIEVADLENTRRALSQTAKQRDPIGRPTPEATAAQAAVRHIDDYLVSIAPGDVFAGDAAAAAAKLTEARGNWAAGKRSSEIDFRLNKAERQAARSGSGMNLENARRQKIDQVADYGLRPEEIALRDKIVLGTPTRNALRTVGKLGVDGGLSLLLNAGAAIGTGGATLPVTVAGTAARLAGQALTKRQIRQLNEMIRSRAPLATVAPPATLPAPVGLLGTIPAGETSALTQGLLGAIAEPPRSRKGNRIKRRSK